MKSGATIGTTADGYSLEGDGLVTRDSIFIQGADTTLHGAVRLLDARIGGQLIVLGGATIGVTSSKYSLDADRLITTGGISIEGAGTMLHGAANVSSANIGGQLAICRGATIGAAIDCYSLRGDRLVATSGVFVDDTNTTLHGAASLNGASISGQFHVARATLGVADGWSVSADSATIDQILVTGAAMSGGINLRHASISQLLTINGATHLNSDGYPTSISMESARVARARLNSSASPGLVDLSGSHLQVLEDNPEFWGFGSQHRCIWRLAGLTVERLAVEPTFTAEQRREWLNLAAGPEGHGPADSGTYRMVARAQVSGGADDDAVDTLRAMRRAHDPPWLKRIHWPIGQGYKPHWALWLLLATLLATFGLTWIGDRNGTFVAVEELSPGDARQEHPLLSSRDCQKEHYPCLRPIVYAVDTIVPGLDLGEAGRWQPATTRQQPGRTDVLRWALVVLRLAGWAFGALFVIGMLNVVVEQRRTK